MPSSKDPNSTIQPGPGRLPANVVPAGALLFNPGGGGGAALAAHINNPKDAHFAHAIGIDPYFPPGSGLGTGIPLLSSVGGVIDGETVLDFINQFSSLIPAHPNYVGFNNASGVTSSIPNWGTLNTVAGGGQGFTGGYDNTGNVAFSHFIVNNATTTFAPSGVLFPADRGVLALYTCNDPGGNYFAPGALTLATALYLGDSGTAPTGLTPGAAFLESTRTTGQTNYTPSNSGIDFITLTHRLPYQTSYVGGTPFGPFTSFFPSFQLAFYNIQALTLTAGGSQHFLIVHFRETYATALSQITPGAGPTNFNATTFTAGNCYSAAGSTFDDNTTTLYNVNRHFVFRDTQSATAPSGNTFTSAVVGSPTTRTLSGVSFYTGAGLSFNVTVRANNLFNTSFDTGSVDNPPNVPAQFHSANDPVQIDFASFSAGLLAVPYYNMKKVGAGSNYSASNSPAPADVAEYDNGALTIVSPTNAFAVTGSAQLRANLRNIFNGPVLYNDTNKYLYDSWTPGAAPPAAGFLATQAEFFVDELYRYSLSFDPTSTAAVPIQPTGGNIYGSGSALTGGGADLQIIGSSSDFGIHGGSIVYPQTNFGAAGIFPAGQPNYSTFPASEQTGSNPPHFRRYMRAFDTGSARNTGTIIIGGITSAATIQALATFDGNEYTGHTTGGGGGIIIQLKIPGSGGNATGWMDLGRATGAGVADFNGCGQTYTAVGSDLHVTFNTINQTGPNGFGQFPLFIRVSYLNVAGSPPVTGMNITGLIWTP